MNIYNATRTIYNIKLQTCMMANIPYQPLPNTTLNEKFDILEYEQQNCVNNLKSDRPLYPTIKGIVIGNGGLSLLDSDIFDLKLGKHSPIDGALFNHLPFVLREENNDLPDTDKLNYRLRKELYIDGKKYVAYYLRIIKESELFYKPDILYVDNNKAIPSIKVLSTDRTDILNPSPVKDNRMSTYNNTVEVYNILRYNFQISERDMLELENVFNVLNIKNRLITELGFVTGIDVPLNNYKELVYSQIGFFIDLSLDLEYLKNQNSITIEIGGGEIIPLMKDLDV